MPRLCHTILCLFAALMLAGTVHAAKPRAKNHPAKPVLAASTAVAPIVGTQAAPASAAKPAPAPATITEPPAATRPTPAAATVAAPAASSRASLNRAYHLSARCAPPPAVVKIPKNRGLVTQKDWDELKAGRPALLFLNLDNSDIQAAAATDRQVRHLINDDAAISQMEDAESEALKAAVLRDYRPEDIQVVGKWPGLAMLTVHIHSLQTLQALLDDPRITAVNSNMPMCPA